MNKFYRQHPLTQWTISLFLLIIAIALLYIWTKKAMENPWWYLAIFPLVPLFQFLITPFSRLTGMYTYLSPMLLVFGASEKKYDLHNGTPFDYFFVMRKVKPGISAQKKILGYYIEGFLKIIEKIEQNELPESIIISGSSYFFSEQTAKRLGFEIKSAAWFEKLNIYLNIIDLCWMYSYSQGKISFPNVNKVKKVQTTGKQLVKQKANLIRLRNYFNRK